MIVGTTAIQFPDGRIDDGSVHEPPRVYVETKSDRGLTTAEARELISVILECIKETDGWVA